MSAMRPPWCLDSTCSPHSNTVSPNDGEGDTAFCCGVVDEPLITDRAGVHHENDGHFCVRSPRGVVMLEINGNDLDLIARCALRSLVARDPERGFGWRWYTGRDRDATPPEYSEESET